MGIATVGTEGIAWGWEGKGVAQIFASWIIAPALAGGFAAIIFLITKYGVMRRSDPLKWGMVMVPIYFAITSGILTMLIVWKGVSDSSYISKFRASQDAYHYCFPQAASLNLDGWGAGKIAGTIFGVSFGVMALTIIFFLPYIHRKLTKDDWTLKWYHMFLGPLLLKRGPVPEAPEASLAPIVQDYYLGHATREDLEAAKNMTSTTNNPEIRRVELEGVSSASRDSDEMVAAKQAVQTNSKSLDEVEKIDAGPWYAPKNLLKLVIDAAMHGVRKDVIAEQSRESKLSGDLVGMHARAAHFDNKTEHLYSFLQVLTAATSSFAHGANDVANATGPLATVFLVWSTNDIRKSKPEVPLWILAYGGAGIVIGLWTYGYNIMRNLGNRLTLHSPSRGFSMELGSAVTVVLATRLSLPVSTTQCIVGATMGVAFCNGDLKALNWRMVGWCYGGWIFTLPIAGIISGCLMGIIINAPRWN